MDLFTIRAYSNVLAKNIIYLVFRSDHDKTIELLREYKKNTSKKVVGSSVNNSQESRKEWLLWMLERRMKINQRFSISTLDRQGN